MSYQLTIQERLTYLHAVVTGRNTKENVVGYLRELRRECEARNCFRALIAFVDVNAAGELMKFAEVVAGNCGVQINVSITVAEAEQWLAAGSG